MGLITLRRALASDADAIAKLWHASWHAGHGSVRGVQQCLLDDRSLAQFEEQTPKLLQAGEHIVAESADCSMAGKLAGFVSVDATEVTQIFVEPEQFGKGVGGTLLAAAEDTIAMSSSVVTEGTGIQATVHALEKNERACRFYAKHGWTASDVLDSKIETTLRRPGALHPTLFMHPWRQVRFQKLLALRAG